MRRLEKITEIRISFEDNWSLSFVPKNDALYCAEDAEDACGDKAVLKAHLKRAIKRLREIEKAVR